MASAATGSLDVANWPRGFFSEIAVLAMCQILVACGAARAHFRGS